MFLDLLFSAIFFGQIEAQADQEYANYVPNHFWSILGWIILAPSPLQSYEQYVTSLLAY